MGRAAENNYTLAEKESIILIAKQKVLNSEYKIMAEEGGAPKKKVQLTFAGKYCDLII